MTLDASQGGFVPLDDTLHPADATSQAGITLVGLATQGLLVVRDSRFAGVLTIVPEIDNVTAAIAGSAYAGQRFGVDGNRN